MMMKISFSPPDMSAEELAEVKDAILSGWITTGDIEILGTCPYRLLLL